MEKETKYLIPDEENVDTNNDINEHLIEFKKREHIYLACISSLEKEVCQLHNYLNEWRCMHIYEDEENKSNKDILNINSLRNLLIDPCVNLEIKELRQKIYEITAKYKVAEEKLQGCNFDAQSAAGQRLINKCKKLQEENYELGKTLEENNLQVSSIEIKNLKQLISFFRNELKILKELNTDIDEDNELLSAQLADITKKYTQICEEKNDLIKINKQLNNEIDMLKDKLMKNRDLIKKGYDKRKKIHLKSSYKRQYYKENDEYEDEYYYNNQEDIHKDEDEYDDYEEINEDYRNKNYDEENRKIRDDDKRNKKEGLDDDKYTNENDIYKKKHSHDNSKEKKVKKNLKQSYKDKRYDKEKHRLKEKDRYRRNRGKEKESDNNDKEKEKMRNKEREKEKNKLKYKNKNKEKEKLKKDTHDNLHDEQKKKTLREFDKNIDYIYNRRDKSEYLNSFSKTEDNTIDNNITDESDKDKIYRRKERSKNKYRNRKRMKLRSTDEKSYEGLY